MFKPDCMKNTILPVIIIVALLSSCSTAYKSTQTPDDVYYSPASGNENKDHVSKEQKQYENDLANNDNQFLWMKVHNYYLWSSIDDYNYWYDPRYYNPGYYFGWSYNGGYFYPAWKSNVGWYARVYPSYKNPSLKGGNTAGANITAYKNRTYNNTNTSFNVKNGSGITNSSGSSFGQLVRKTFAPASSSNNGGWSIPVRSFAPSTSSAPSSSGSAGGHSGGASSSGSSSSGGRGGRGN